jgi:hypothetical protein
MLGYLNISGLDVALLLNFREVKLQWKRVINDRKNPPAISFDDEVGSNSVPRMGTDGHG